MLQSQQRESQAGAFYAGVMEETGHSRETIAARGVTWCRKNPVGHASPLNQDPGTDDFDQTNWGATVVDGGLPCVESDATPIVTPDEALDDNVDEDAPQDGDALIQEARIARNGRTAGYDANAVAGRLAEARREARERSGGVIEVPIRVRKVTLNDAAPFEAKAADVCWLEGMIDDEPVFESPAITNAEADAMKPAYDAALRAFATELYAGLAAASEG